MNKLYILRPVKDDELWYPWYDKSFGFIVCAESPKQARLLASTKCGEEGEEAWLDAAHSICSQLKPSKKTGIVMQDFAAAQTSRVKSNQLQHYLLAYATMRVQLTKGQGYGYIRQANWQETYARGKSAANTYQSGHVRSNELRTITTSSKIYVGSIRPPQRWSQYRLREREVTKRTSQ